MVLRVYTYVIMSERLDQRLVHEGFARLFHAASYIAKNVKPVGDFMHGKDRRVQRNTFRVVRPLNYDEEAWAHYKGNPKAPWRPIPREYPSVVRTWVNPEKAQDIHDNLDDTAVRPAIALRLGETAAVAVLLGAEAAEGVLRRGYYDSLLSRGDLETTIALVGMRSPHYLMTFNGIVQPGPVFDRKTEYNDPNGVIY